MATIYYAFEVRDSTITTGDNRKTGLIITVAGIKTIGGSPATVSTSNATVAEIELGVYQVAYDPDTNGDAAISLDATSALTNPSDRYINMTITRDPGRVLNLPSAAPGATSGLPVLGESAQLLDTADITAIWAALTSGMTTNNSIGAFLKLALPLSQAGHAGGLPTLSNFLTLLSSGDLSDIAASVLTTPGQTINTDIFGNVVTTDHAAVSAIKTTTDKFRFTVDNQVDANALTGGITAAEVWDALTSGLTTPATIGYFILQKLGLISAETVIVPGITLPASKEFCLLRGDAYTLSFNCVNTGGTAYDLTGSDLLFLAKNYEGDADVEAVITKTPDITDAAAGQCSVPLTGDDTTGLQTGTYWWGIKDLNADKTVTRGTIELQAEPVKAISA